MPAVVIDNVAPSGLPSKQPPAGSSTSPSKPGGELILSISLPHAGVTKKMRFAASMTAADAVAQAAELFSRSKQLTSSEVVPFLRLYKKPKGKEILDDDVSLEASMVKSSDTLYLLDKRDPGGRSNPTSPRVITSSSPLILNISQPHTGITKKMKFTSSMTAEESATQAADQFIRTKQLIGGPDIIPFLRLYKKENGKDKLKKLLTLDESGVQSNDTLYLLDKRNPSGKSAQQFNRLIQRKGKRVDIVFPYSVLRDWGKSGPCSESLLSGASKIGYLVKEGSNVKSWKRRLFVLHNETLYYFVDENSFEAKGFVVLTKGAKIVFTDDSAKRSHMFSIHTVDRTMHCAAASAEERQEWRDALESVIAGLSDQSTLNRTPPETVIIETFWIQEDLAATPVWSLVRRALKKAFNNGLNVCHEITDADAFGEGPFQTAPPWTLHSLGGEQFELAGSLSDVWAAAPGSESVQLQLKSTLSRSDADAASGGGGGGGATLRRNARNAKLGAAKVGAKLGKAFSRTKKAVSGRPAADAASGDGPVSPRTSASRAKSTPALTSSHAETKKVAAKLSQRSEEVKLLDSSVVRTKPKSAGRRPPTRNKKTKS